MRTQNLLVLAGVLVPSALSLALVLASHSAHPVGAGARPEPTPDPREHSAESTMGALETAEPAPLPRQPLEDRMVDGPPVSLTASDGSGLALASLRASAVIEGPLAFTEVHLTFDNPENRVREGTFKIVLPQGASLGRFAMKINDAWQEGEIVARERARRVYEDFLHRKQDPALMEKGAGNEFTARVFPIPARGRKEIVVSYAQELVGGAPYTLPLRGLPELGELDVSVSEPGGAPQTLRRSHVTPGADFVAETKAKAASVAVRSGNLVVARVRPVPEAMPDPVRGAVVLVDTSASRALGLAAELRAVTATLHALADREGGSLKVTVAAFDQEVASIFEGDAKAFGDREIAQITERRALGASNLERALGWAKDEARRVGATRVILVTDGVPTAGEDDAAKLGAVAASLKGGGAQRLDVIAVGGLRDDALAHKLVTAGLAHDGVVVAATDGSAAVARRLEAGTRSDVAVAVEGATWSYPTRLDGVQPGDEVLVYAELPEGAPLRVRVGDQPSRALEASAVDRPLVERAWAQAKIASLEGEERDHGKSPELERRIVDLSTQHRVLSAYTSLLVLETDADYARFHIDRSALASVLTVDGGRLALARRGEVVHGGGRPWAQGNPDAKEAKKDRAPDPAGPGAMASAAPREERELEKAARANGVGESFGAGGLGLSGIGQGGGGAGSGAGHLASAAPPRDDEGATGARAKGEEGSMGNPLAQAPARAEAPAATATAAPEAPARVTDAPALDVAPTTPAARPAPAMRAAAPPPSRRGDGYGETRSLGMIGGSDGAGEEGGADPYTGKMKQVKDRLAHRDPRGALAAASAWQAQSPGDVLALVALGETSEATGDPSTARRAYGSIIDLFASRADLRRFAGERLEHVAGADALDLAIDTFDKARRDRPDHPASHRLAAFARVRKGDFAGAFDVAVAGLAQRYPEGRFRGVDRILREDLGLIAAAWMHAEPSRASEILARLRAVGGSIEDRPSVRFVLNWETDANDVDFHIRDGQGGHAYYGSPQLPSGGELYADVTTGYGPECFTIREPRGHRAGPYTLRAHYYSRGPMGYGMGKLEVIDHDGHGGLKFEERPFLVMADHAFVDLGTTR